ncbi:MAG: hypothetical protein AAF612_06200, partial [Planctomycetota bacterium]
MSRHRASPGLSASTKRAAPSRWAGVRSLPAVLSAALLASAIPGCGAPGPGPSPTPAGSSTTAATNPWGVDPEGFFDEVAWLASP